jgi:hypothetical protein
MRSRDPVQSTVVGIAAVAALLVAGGLTLSVVGALDSTGWLVLVLVLVLAAAVAARDPVRLAVPALLAVVALGLSVGALALSRASAEDHAAETTFSQLWVVERGSAGRAEVGIRNEEQMPVTFQLRVLGPESKGARPLLERTVALEPSQAWSQEIAIPRSSRPERVAAELYRLGETEPYRRAHVWTAPGN